MHKIGIVINEKKSGAQALLAEMAGWLAKRGCEVLTSLTAPADQIVKEVELVICAGGDGTLLSLARQMVEHPVPVLGVNLGNLGFITEVKQEEVLEELKSIFAGHYEVEERSMLAASVRDEKTRESRRFQALNDIVINREGLTRYLRVEVRIGQEPFTSFSGDGLIMATPTGSTAYSLSSGGPIVHPVLDAIIITAICPHVSSLRPMVVPGSQKISAKVYCDSPEEAALLVADGQESMKVTENHQIEVTQGPVKLKLIKSSKRTYFETLREKFKIPLQ